MPQQQPILISIRADQELNETKLSNEISKALNKNVLNLKTLSKDQQKKSNTVFNTIYSFSADGQVKYLYQKIVILSQLIHINDY